MSKVLSIHPENPQYRLIKEVVDLLENGGIIAYPTDSGYALGCALGNKNAMDQIINIRKLRKHHHFTLMMKDLSHIGEYAKLNNSGFRLLKKILPGAYTFILPATKEVPRRLQHPKRKTIGLRIPDNKIALALLEELDEPIMSSTFIMPGEDLPMSDVDDIVERVGMHVALIIDGGYSGSEPTTVVEFIDDIPEIMRSGLGDLTPFEV